MCTIVRIDATDQNVNCTQNLGALQQDSTNAYVFWAGRNDTYVANAAHNAEIWVRPIVKSTLALGVATKIDTNDVVGGEEAWDWDGVAVCRLTSGVMIAAYGTSYLGVGPSIHAKESAANDSTTWGSRYNGFVAGAGRCVGGLGTDGTNVFLLSQDNNTADVYMHKRTAANTWSLCATALGSGKIYDSSGFSSSAPFYAISTVSAVNSLGSMRNFAVQDENVHAIVLLKAQTSTTLDAVSCLWTTDGWATTHETRIKNYAGSADTCLSQTKAILGSDGRLRAMWIENNAALGRFVPVLAYSDTMGQTWTILGTPTAFTTFDWDPDWDGVFALDSENHVYVAGFDDADASNLKHHIFSGGDSLTGWVETVCEHIAQPVAGATCADGFISSNGKFIRVFNAVAGSGPSYNTVDYLIEDVPEEPGGPPPLVEESPSGSDATNIVLRNRLSTRRGWSAHDWPFSCFAGWPEGDYTTQRRLPIKIAGLSVIDPSVSDPSALPAIMKFDDPEHLGRERFMYSEGGTVVPRLDPFYAQAHTKAFNLSDDAGVAIVRGVMVSYRRIGATLPVQIWIDGVLAQTSILPETGAQGGPDDVFAMKERFIPLARLTNVGRTCQLRFEDESLFPFWIEWVAIKKIKKRIRARNQS